MRSRIGMPVRIGQRQASAGPAAPAAGGRLIRMVIKRTGDSQTPVYEDHIVCYRKDDPTQKDVRVAKPWDLQKTPWHLKSFDSIGYNYLSPVIRRATLPTGQSQEETIKPPYRVGREIVVGYPIEGGTGVSSGETVGSQRLANSDLSEFGGGWLFDPNSEWGLFGSEAQHAPGGAGRIYGGAELLVPGSLYDVRLTISYIDGPDLVAYCGTEFAVFSGTATKRIRCQGNGLFAIHAEADTTCIVDSVTATVVEPADTPYQDINAAGRQWYRIESS